MAELLTLKLRRELVEEFGSMDDAIEAIDSPGPEYAGAWGDSWLVLPSATSYLERVTWVYLASKGHENGGRPAIGARAVGRPKGSGQPIPDRTLLEILRLAAEEQASARAIADATEKGPNLSFVNRTKAGAILKWVKSHPAEARRAVARQEIPADFPATSGGRLLPKH